MSMRTRWAAVGAAVAVTLGAGGISIGQAAIGTGARPVFVAIAPCRLVDTRPGPTNIGGRTAALGAGDTLTLQVTGSTGQCSNIPDSATAAAMNVTAIQGSTRSYLTIYPADTTRPNASNLNWNGGDPPTPNKVDVKLSPTGAIKITNDTGTVHVAADLVGYYTTHHHDDRYYTKNQVDAGFVATASTSAYRVYHLNVLSDGITVNTVFSSPELADTVITRLAGQPVGHYCVDLPDDGSFAVHGTVGTPVALFAGGLGGADELLVLTTANDGCLSANGADLSVRLGDNGVVVDAAYVLLIPGR